MSSARIVRRVRHAITATVVTVAARLFLALYSRPRPVQLSVRLSRASYRQVQTFMLVCQRQYWSGCSGRRTGRWTVLSLAARRIGNLRENAKRRGSHASSHLTAAAPQIRSGTDLELLAIAEPVAGLPRRAAHPIGATISFIPACADPAFARSSVCRGFRRGRDCARARDRHPVTSSTSFAQATASSLSFRP